MVDYKQSNYGSDLTSNSLLSIFLDEDYFVRFNKQLKKLNENQQTSTEYQSGLFTLTNKEELYKKSIPYFSSNGFSHLDMF